MASIRDLGIITLFLAFISIAAGCSTGKIYLGSLNETYPEHIKRNGIYVQETQEYNGHAVYRHTRTGEFLYFLSGSLVGGHWAVGAQPGSTDAFISVLTSVMSPELVRNRAWHVLASDQTTWLAVPGLKAVCVDEDFMICNSGKIVISGLERGSHIQVPRMGEYQITDQISSLRPVYHKEGDVDEYLFFQDDFWIIGPSPGTVSGGLLCVDQAWKPEYITSPWIVFDGYRFERNDGIFIRCKGNDLEKTPDEDPATPPGESSAELCDQDPCENGADCLVSLETDSLLCDCQAGFYGSLCENAISCGSPPDVGNGHVVGTTGSNYLDVTFYSCDNNLVPSAERGVVCLSDDTWSTAPSCTDVTAIFPMVMGSSPLEQHREAGRRRNERLRSLSNVLTELSRK